MFLIVLVAAFLIYLSFVLAIAAIVFKLTRRHGLSLAVSIGLLILPVHEGVFGYPAFGEFDEQHQGVQCPDNRQADGFLVEGRRASSPSEAINADGFPGNFRYKEFPRDMVASLTPAPREPLAAFVQFFQTTTDDPACTQPFDSAPSSPNCVGVTSSGKPKSVYAVFREPDERAGTVHIQLNESRLFPILGTHTRVREVKSNRIVAEEWTFALPSKVFPEFFWFFKRNPAGRIPASLCLSSTVEPGQ